MKLKIEHLSPYLPYNLKLIFESKGGRVVEITGLRTALNILEDKRLIFFNTTTDTLSIDYFKPILKPLSDLLDNILYDDNDENYNLSCELAELLNTNDSSYFVKALIENKYYAMDCRLWKDIEEWFYKNHFDWKYNLISENLAISIHDVGVSYQLTVGALRSRG